MTDAEMFQVAANVIGGLIGSWVVAFGVVVLVDFFRRVVG